MPLRVFKILLSSVIKKSVCYLTNENIVFRMTSVTSTKFIYNRIQTGKLWAKITAVCSQEI